MLRLVPVGDVSALAAVIPTVVRLCRIQAHKRAERGCSQERMVNDYVRLYRKVAW